MLTTISVSENLIREAGIYGKADQRSVSFPGIGGINSSFGKISVFYLIGLSEMT